MFRNLGAIALVLCVPDGFAGEVGGGREYVYADTLQGVPARVTLTTSPRNDLTLAWTDVGSDGSLDVFATVREGFFFRRPVTVNATTAGDQVSPRLVRAANDRLVAVWVSGTDVYGQQLYGSLWPAGSEIHISTGGGTHSDPAVAIDAFGNFVVVWRRMRHGVTELVARRFSTDSEPVGPVFKISTPSTVPAGAAAIAMATRGDFAVAWQGTGGSGNEIHVRAFAADGTPVIDAMPVGVAPASGRSNPALAMDAHGGFVVAWSNRDAAGSNTIQARQHLAGGVPIAPEFAVASAGADSQSAPAAAMDASGDFVLSWDEPGLSGRTIRVQLFTPDGARNGGEVSIGDGWLTAPAVSMDADGDAAVAAVRQWGSQAEVAAVTLVGPEPIDAELSISESVDPVMLGSSVRYTITVTNRHPASAETGIPQIDSAFGWLPEVAVAIGHGGVATYPRDCFQSWYDSGLFCRRSLAAGDSHSFDIDVTPSELPEVGIYAHIDTLKFVDPDPGNSYDEETTEVVCSNGQGAGFVRISRAPTTVEEGGTADFEVERIEGSCGEVSVRYNPYVPDLRWADGELGSRLVTLTDLNPQDNIDEDPKTGAFGLFLPQGGIRLGEPSRVTYTLADDDPEPTVSITPASLIRGESDSNYLVDFFVTLSHPSSRQPVVQFALGGTATRDSDYRVISPTADYVTFGSTFPTERVTLRLIKDSMTEQDETVVVTLTDATNAVILPQSSGTLTIQDDDRPTVTIVAPDMTIAEGGTTTTVMIRLSRPASVPVTVPLNWGGSAMLDSDFSAPTSVTIPAGTGQAYLAFPVLTDGLDEDVETAVLTLGQPSIGELGADTSYVLSITDIDPTPTIRFLERIQQGTEGGSITLAAELSAVSGREVRVTLLRSGQAQLGSDFTMSNEAIVIPAGTKISGPVLSLTDDAQVETPETATFSMDSMTNVLPGAQTEETVTILDNDPTVEP